MKRSLVLIALLLCFSLIFVGCNTNDPADTDAPGATNAPATSPNGDANSNGGNTVISKPLDKAEVIAGFNSIKLDELFDTVTEGEMGDIITSLLTAANSGDVSDVLGLVLPAFSNVKGEIDLDLKSKYDLGLQKVVVAVKDGLVYIKGVEGSTDEEGYVYFGSGKPAFFEKEDGVWTKVDPFADDDVIVDDNIGDVDIFALGDAIDEGIADAMLAQVKEILGKIVIPELKDSDIIEGSDGMFILNNDYIAELMCANASLISGEEVPADEIEEGRTAIKNTLAAFGLKIAFGGNDGCLNKFSVSIKTADTEDGKAAAEKLDGIVSASVVIELTSDGSMLKSIEADITPLIEDATLAEYLEDYDLTSSLKLTTLFDDEGVACGFDLKIEGAVVQNLSGSGVREEDGSFVASRAVMVGKITLDCTVDTRLIGAKDATVLDFKFDVKPVKVFDVNTQGNVNDPSTIVTTVTPVDESKYGDYVKNENAELKIVSIDANKLTVSMSMTYAGEEMVSVSGAIYLNTVLNFPTDIPQIVKEHIASVK